MKVALIGTHGVGKTTLCFELAARLKRLDVDVELVREVARHCPLPINRDTSAAAQSWILHTQMAWELEASAQHTLVLCDRSVLDNYCYLLYATGPQPSWEALLTHWLSTYELLIKVPLWTTPRWDGVRDTDLAFQRDIDALLDEQTRRARCCHPPPAGRPARGLGRGGDGAPRAAGPPDALAVPRGRAVMTSRARPADPVASAVLIVLGVGANRGDVLATLARTRRELEGRFEVLAASSLWRTQAIGPQQPDFVNGALLLRTAAHPRTLLVACHDLETAAGRNRDTEPRWGPRPLDLDLLLADVCVMTGPNLCLPHPRLETRRFALAPAAEIVPGWHHQRRRRTIAELARDPHLEGQRCELIGPYPGR